MRKIYDVGDLKNHPTVLYDLCVKLDPLEFCPWNGFPDSEALQVLRDVVNSLWSALPPVITIDLCSDD